MTAPKPTRRVVLSLQWPEDRTELELRELLLGGGATRVDIYANPNGGR